MRFNPKVAIQSAAKFSKHYLHREKIFSASVLLTHKTRFLQEYQDHSILILQSWRFPRKLWPVRGIHRVIASSEIPRSAGKQSPLRCDRHLTLSQHYGPSNLSGTARFEERPNSGRFTNRPYRWCGEIVGFEIVSSCRSLQ